MKNLKILLSAFSLIFTILISTAGENQSNLDLICHSPLGLVENENCPKEELKTNLDIAFLDEYELINEEVDELFDFDLGEYLPSGFNQYSEDEFNLVAFELLKEKNDEQFEFDSKKYLPADFNPYNEDDFNLTQHELLNEEKDEKFDFNTLDYLPMELHALK